MTRTAPFWHTTAALHTCQENVSVYILYQYVYNVMWNGWKVFMLDLRPLASFAQMISITTRPRPWPWAHHMHTVHVPSASDSSSAAKNTSLDLVRQNQTKPCCSPHEATKHFKQVTFRYLLAAVLKISLIWKYAAKNHSSYYQPSGFQVSD